MIKLTITNNTGATITATNEYFIETLLELSYQENPAFIPFFDELAFYAEDLRAERSPMVSDDDVAEEAFWDLLPEFGLEAEKLTSDELMELLHEVAGAASVTYKALKNFEIVEKKHWPYKQEPEEVKQASASWEDKFAHFENIRGKAADYLFNLASGRMTHCQARNAITNHPAMLLNILESM